MKRLVLAAALAALACTSHASTVWVMQNSYHFDRTVHYNETNPGLMLESHGVIVGGYVNSYGKSSTLAGGVWRPIEYGAFKAGVMGGLVTGYKSPFMAAVVSSYSFGHFSVQLSVVPVKQGVATLQIGWSE